MRKFLVFTLLILFVFSLTAGPTVRFGLLSEPHTLDPADQWEIENSIFALFLFDRLVELDFTSSRIKPSLAVSWKSYDGGKRWVFTLRKGVKFHDGTELTSWDVVFSFRRQMEKDFPYRFGKFEAFPELYPFLKRVRALGRYKVEFLLSRSFSPFLSTLALEQASVVSAKAIMKLREGFARNPVGTGPYRLVEWKKGKQLILEENPHYWRARPGISKLIFTFSPNHDELIFNLKNGKLDVVNIISLLQLPSIKRISWLKIEKKVTYGITFIALNLKKRPFSDRRVRRALNHLFNRRSINIVFKGLHRPAYTPIPPGMSYRVENPSAYRFDIKKARKLLAEAGYRKGFRIKVYLGPRESLLTRLMEIYSRNLAKVGIKLDIIKKDYRKMDELIKQGKYDMVISSWLADYPDPDSILYPLFSERVLKMGFANMAGLGNRELVRLVEEARFETSLSRRAWLYRKIQKLIEKEQPWIPLYYPVEAAIYNCKKIEKVVITPLGRIFLYGKGGQ